MKQILFSLLLAIILNTGCKKDETIQTGDNLVTNGSFELNGNFSLSGWSSASTTSNTDVPSDGGNFSLKITPGIAPSEGYADYEVTDIVGTKSFQLNCCIKSFGAWPGSVTLRKVEADGTTTILGSLATSENSWILETMDVSTSLATGDKLVIHLSAGSTESGTPDQYALFDLVELTEQ